MFDEMMDPSMMGMPGMEEEMGPHPSMTPPPLSTQGGLQPKQEFVSPGDMPGSGGLFDTLMGQELGGPMGPPVASLITGAPPPPKPPTAMQPPASDMMQNPELFNTMMMNQVQQSVPPEDENQIPY